MSVRGRRVRFGVQASISLAISGILVATVMSPVQADPLTPVVSPLGDPIDVLPASVSDAVELPPVEWPSGDFTGVGTDVAALEEDLAASLPQRGVGPDEPTPGPGVVLGEVPAEAVLGEQTEFTNDYVLPGGGHLLESSMFPINAVDDSGDWVPVSTDLDVQPDGSLTADAHPLDPEFAPEANQTDAFAVERDGYSIGFTLVGAADSPAVHLEAPRRDTSANVSYKEVFDDVDLDYEVQSAGVKEQLVVDSLPSQSDASWSWLIDAPGLDLQANEVGDIEFIDSAGAVRFHIPRPLMWDSSGVEGQSANATENVPTTLVHEGSRWKLTLTPDFSWLADAARVFPIVVDPSVDYGPSPLTSYKSNGPTSSGVLLVGNTRESNTNKYWRAIAKYSYSALDNKHLIGASLGLGYANYSATAVGGNVWTALDSCFSCNGTLLTSYPAIGTGTGYASGVNMGTRYAKEIGNNNWGLTLMITGDESANYTLKQYTSRMFFRYTNYPTVTAQTAPANNATNVSLTPVLTATGTDPTAGSGDSDLEHGLSFQYVIGTTSVPEDSTVYTSEWTDLDGTTGSLRVPAGVLEPSTKYYWRAYVKDAYDGVYKVSDVRKSATVTSFTTNATVPYASQSNSTPSYSST
jgi:hypothetical protein